MKTWYMLIGLLNISLFFAMDPDKDRLKQDAQEVYSQISEKEREAVIQRVKDYLHEWDPTLEHKIADALGHKHEQHSVHIPPLTPAEEAEWDKLTIAKDGSILLTLREKIAMRLAEDPRIEKANKRDFFYELTRDMERAQLPESLVHEVNKAREHELKVKGQNKQPSAYDLLAPHYNYSIRTPLEDFASIQELDFTQQLTELRNKKAAGHTIGNLTFDNEGRTVITRLFEYRKTTDNYNQKDPKRAFTGNLDTHRLSDMHTLANELGLDFNKPDQTGEFPIHRAIALGRVQAASQLTLGTANGQKLGNGPVKVMFSDEELRKNPLLLTLGKSLNKTLKAFAYDSQGKLIPENEKHIKLHYFVLGRYILQRGANTTYPKDMHDPVEFARKKGFNEFAELIELMKEGKEEEALKLVSKQISQTTQEIASLHVAPYRMF